MDGGGCEVTDTWPHGVTVFGKFRPITGLLRGKSRPIIGLCGKFWPCWTSKNSELYPWDKYGTCVGTPWNRPPLPPFVPKCWRNMNLNLLKRGASREARCGKFRPIIGLRGIWKNSELHPWGEYEICEGITSNLWVPSSPPPYEPKCWRNMKRIEGIMKEYYLESTEARYESSREVWEKFEPLEIAHTYSLILCSRVRPVWPMYTLQHWLHFILYAPLFWVIEVGSLMWEIEPCLISKSI